jgi:hypothetical protein
MMKLKERSISGDTSSGFAQGLNPAYNSAIDNE